MPTSSIHFLQFSNGKIQYLKIGTGSKLLLAFHGYGNEASMFLPLNDFIDNQYTIFSINLPHHGESQWNENIAFSIDDAAYLVRQLMLEFKVEKFSLLGYSMGGRICLSIVEHMSEHIDNCLLIASDGLVFNPFYFFATQTVLGFLLLKRFVNHPDNYIRIIKWLRHKKWIDAARYKFVMNYVISKEERLFLFKVWPTMKHFIPHKRQIEKVVNNNQIQLLIFSGNYDRVIPPKHAISFQRIVPSCRLINLDKGHRIFEKDTWKIISECL